MDDKALQSLLQTATLRLAQGEPIQKVAADLTTSLNRADSTTGMRNIPLGDMAAARALFWAGVDPNPEEDELSGRYVVVELIGKGGMGEVVLAYDDRLRREVAIKRLRKDQADEDAVGRFLQEAQVTAQLDHPNIMPVYDMGTGPDGAPFFAMKRVLGRSLQEKMNDGQLGSMVVRMDVFRKICDAIAFAHSRGVLHRDLKPGNVMVGEFGEVLVLDWGCAKMHSADEEDADERQQVTSDRSEIDSDRTIVGSIIGTPAYMSPEQAQGQVDSLDERSDVYSLGAILYALVAGRKPYSGTAREVLDMVAAGRVPAPRRRHPSFPRELEAIVLHAMEKDPAARYGSVIALRNDVQSWLEGLPVSVMRYSRLLRIRKWFGRHRKAAWASAITAAIAMIALLVLGARHLSQVEAARSHAELAEHHALVQRADALAGSALATARLGRPSDALRLLDEVDGNLKALGAPMTKTQLIRSELAVQTLSPRLTIPVDSPPTMTTVSDDDRRAVVVDQNGIGRVYDLLTGEVLQVRELVGRVMGLAFIDGRGLAMTAFDDRVERVWLDSGEVLEVPGTWNVRIANKAGIALLWPKTSGEPPRAIRLTTGEDLGLRVPEGYVVTHISADGSILMGRSKVSIDAGRSFPICAFERETGRILSTYTPGPGKLAPNGAWLARDSTAGVEIHRIRDGARIGLAKTDTFKRHLSYQVLDDNRLLTWSWTGEVSSWSIDTDTMEIRLLESAATSMDTWKQVQVGPSGTVLVTTNHTAISVWPAQPGDRRFSWKVEEPGSLRGGRYHPSGEMVASYGESGVTILWDVVTSTALAEYGKADGSTFHVAFAEDGRRMLTSNRDRTARVWDLESGEVLATQDHDHIGVAGFWVDEDTVLSAATSGEFILWNARTGERLGRWQSEQHSVWHVAPVASGERFIMSSNVMTESSLLLYETRTGVLLDSYEGLGQTGFQVAAAPNGEWYLRATHGEHAEVYTPGSEVRRLGSFQSITMGAAISPDGALVALGAYDGRLHIFETRDWTEVHAFLVGKTPVITVEHAPDGQTILGTTGKTIALIPMDLNRHLAEASLAVEEDRGARLERRARGAMLRGDWVLAARMWQDAEALGVEVPTVNRVRAHYAAGEVAEARALAVANQGTDTIMVLWRNFLTSSD
jgi:WD40 repeat protein/tRNA A-37 threonylcarbamoyl transferase component Bud32